MGVELTVFGAEDVDEVVALVDAGHGVGVGYGFFKIWIAFGVGHRTEDVGHRHLEGDVHTTLEVKTEPYAELLYFVESIT